MDGLIRLSRIIDKISLSVGKAASWLIVLAVVLVLFGGRGKLSQLMGDFGKGVNAFKKSLREDESFEEKSAANPPRVLPTATAASAEREREPDPTRRP